MSVRVQLPPLLRHLTGERWMDASGSTAGEALRDLACKHPPLALHFFDEQGQLRHNIVCVHDGAVVRAREMAAYALQPGDEIILANALAGG